ncbi:MAG: SDR family oxidoreductase [Fimbriimonadaceae bacterium]
MNLELSGKIAMVAAASKGIGLAVAKMLSEEGCLVSICSRSPESVATATALVPNSRGYTCDVSKAADLVRWHEETVNDLGAPAILITNTGGPPAGSLDQMTDEQWQSGFDSTLMNVVRLVRLVAPDMKSAGWGRIVHITSLAAKEPSRLLPISSTLRAGLMALTRLQATDLAPFGVTVNSVLPGHTMTDRQVHLAEIIAERDGISPQEALKRQAQTNPMGRIGEPEEIAAAALFLCSARSSFITGVNLLVDGGSVKSPA